MIDSTKFIVLLLRSLPRCKRSSVWLVLNADTVWYQASLCPHWLELLALPLREAPLAADVDLLATGELELGTSESLDDLLLMNVLGAHGQDNLSDVNTGDGSKWLSVGTTHSSLEPICTGARQHLVDADDMERVGSHSHVERVFTSKLDEVLVSTDTTCLEGLGGDLLELIRHEVDAQGELVYLRLLTTEVKDADLGIGDTTTET